MSAPEDQRGADSLRLALLQARVEDLYGDLRELRVSTTGELKDIRLAIQELREGVERREKERADKERQQLWNGIKFLLTVLGILGGLIWAYRATILGSPPDN